jgi:excisionase family DNA binding protein
MHKLMLHKLLHEWVSACTTKPVTDTDLIGSAEACQLLGIDRATLSRWVADKRITPAHALPGRTGARLFHRRDITDLAATK